MILEIGIGMILSISFFTLFVSLFLIIAIYAFTIDHKVRFYYIDGTSVSTPVIKGDINWADDLIITLPTATTFDQAIELTKKMNESLSK